MDTMMRLSVPTHGTEVWELIEFDLNDPALTPAARALAELGAREVACRSLRTRRELLADLPAEQRAHREEQAAAFGIDLDEPDEVVVSTTSVYHSPNDPWKPGRPETPVGYLNRIAAEHIPLGYYPVRAAGIGSDRRSAPSADLAATDAARYLSITEFAALKGVTRQTLDGRRDLPKPDATIGEGSRIVRGWRPETIDAYDMVSRQGARTDLGQSGPAPF